MPQNKKIKTTSSQALFPPSTEAVLSRIRESENDLLELIEAYEESNNNFIKKCYYHADLIEFWDEILKSPKKLAQSIKIYEFPPFQQQPGLHSFNFIAGFCYFCKGHSLHNDSRKLANKDNYNEGLEFLLIAEKYQSYHAIALLNKYALDNLYKITDLQEAKFEIGKIFFRLEKLKLHGTPGYIYLIRACIKIADYYKNKNSKEGKENIHNAYQLAVQYAQIALLLEPYCSAAIHNAYFGHGIEEVLILKHTAFKDLATAVEGCCNLAKSYLEPEIINIAKHAAKIEAENFLAQVYPEAFKECELMSFDELPHKAVKR
jgi:hypothetical protein